MTTEIMRQLVVYDHPKDLPDFFVARWCAVHQDGRVVFEKEANCFKSLDRLRSWIAQEYPWLACIPRFDLDDPVIVEVWL